MKLVIGFAVFTITVGFALVAIEALKRRGIDPVGSAARFLSPDATIVAEQA